MDRESWLYKIRRKGQSLLHFIMPDKWMSQIYSRAVLKKKVDLDNPKTFNEKIQWCKLHYYPKVPLIVQCSDKYAVRRFIEMKGYAHTLTPLIGVWDNAKDINWGDLPEKFVLKCNHNSGTGMCICKDKSKLDIEKTKRGLKRGLRQDYHLHGREWIYKDIKRRIIAEKFMEDASGEGLKDYKVMCFDGEPAIIQIHSGRFTDHRVDWYDTQWNLLDAWMVVPPSGVAVDKPPFLDELLEVSRKLSAGIPQLRVDWYYTNGQLYFGELTFFNASGLAPFSPEEWDRKLGDMIQLPK